MNIAPYYRITEGADTAVLCIHGIVGTPAHFDGLLPVIPESWSVYNILLDGHGKNVEDFSRTSMETWKRQVSEQLSEILETHQKVLIVAHSMGTLFAIREAIRHPDRVKGLFLLAVPLTPRVLPSTALNALRAVLGRAGNGAAQEILQDCGVHLSPNLFKYIGWIPRYWELLRECRAVRKLLPLLTVPTCACQSRKDELVGPGACKYLEHHPCIRLTVLENSGHFAYRGGDIQLLQQLLRQQLERI